MTKLFFVLWIPVVLLAEKTPREIRMHTELKNGKVAWAPDKVSVRRGEKVRFVVEHKVEGEFRIHGFHIPALKIAKHVERDGKLEVDATIPNDLELGEHPIACQFHLQHGKAKLVVER